MNCDNNFSLIEGIHIPVTNSDGFVEMDDEGRWLILDKKQHNLLAMVPNEQVLNFFGIESSNSTLSTSQELSLEETVSVTPTPNENSEQRNPWNRVQIMALIQFYKKYQSYFKNTSVKNDKVWSWISKDLKSHTSEQCKNKFKYLKSKYIEKKDNMSSKSSGAKAIKFEYFDDFEDIFGHEPNIVPVSVASSTRGESNLDNTVPMDEETLSDSSTENKGKKRKRSVLEKELDKYGTSLKIKEQEMEKRHTQILERQDKALNVLERMANAFEKFVEKN